MPTSNAPIGASWWAQRWIGALEAFGADYQSRLARGRSYARSGRVLKAEVHPGRITAQVQGSYTNAYRVEIGLTPFTDATWERIITVLAAQALYAAKLLAGEMPTDIDAILSAAGAQLFPQRPDDIVATCSCMDWMRPCKHVAAVHYLFAGNLDTQPYLLFTLRGRTIDEVVAAMRARWADDVTGEVAPAGTTSEAEPVDEVAAPLRAANFYHAGPDLDNFQITIAPPQVEAALLKRLGRPPFAGEHEDPLPALTRAYASVTTRALQALGRSGEQRRKRGVGGK